MSVAAHALPAVMSDPDDRKRSSRPRGRRRVLRVSLAAGWQSVLDHSTSFVMAAVVPLPTTRVFVRSVQVRGARSVQRKKTSSVW